MGYATLADAAVVAHFGFLVFLVLGGLAALRWRRLIWPHVLSVVWSVGILTVGQRCPLTALERWATARAGGPVSDEGFIDRYVEDVVYPGSLTGPVRAAVAVVVVVSWLCLPPVRRRLLQPVARVVPSAARLAARRSRSSVRPSIGAAAPAPPVRSVGAGAGAGAGQERERAPARSSTTAGRSSGLAGR
jgi:hypothetical protein